MYRHTTNTLSNQVRLIGMNSLFELIVFELVTGCFSARICVCLKNMTVIELNSF